MPAKTKIDFREQLHPQLQMNALQEELQEVNLLGFKQQRSIERAVNLLRQIDSDREQDRQALQAEIDKAEDQSIEILVQRDEIIQRVEDLIAASEDQQPASSNNKDEDR